MDGGEEYRHEDEHINGEEDFGDDGSDCDEDSTSRRAMLMQGMGVACGDDDDEDQ